MRTLTLGRSGVQVTEPAFGAAGIAGLYTPVSEEQAYAALDAGIRYFVAVPVAGGDAA
jgi:D-threo-aldose 1-dehydrogenase